MQPCMGRVQKTGHFFSGFAFDPHGQAKRADLQIAQTAIQNLAEQVCGLRAVQRPRAVFAASDFFDVCAYAHGGIVGDAANTGGQRLRDGSVQRIGLAARTALAIECVRFQGSYTHANQRGD